MLVIIMMVEINQIKKTNQKNLKKIKKMKAKWIVHVAANAVSANENKLIVAAAK